MADLNSLEGGGISYQEVQTYFVKKGITNSITKQLVTSGVASANGLEIWNWFRTFDPGDKGYYFDTHPNVSAMFNSMDGIPLMASTFSLVMRHLQIMAKDRKERPYLFDP